MLCKLQHGFESPGGLVKTQIAGLTPRVSDSVGLIGGWVEKGEQQEFTFPTHFPGDTEATCLGTSLRTTVLKNAWHCSWSDVQTVGSHKTQAMRGVKMEV